MIQPGHIYDWAKRCYACHLVMDGGLVDQGKHDPGRETFELLAWSLGEVHHEEVHHAVHVIAEAEGEEVGGTLIGCDQDAQVLRKRRKAACSRATVSGWSFWLEPP